MERFYLAFKGYDVHELACHFVARHAGLYERHGLQPRLIDSTFLADEALPANTFQVACGAALAAWLKGADVRVVFVAAERPMFWLYSTPGQGLDDLRDQPIAGFPDHAPPAAFLRAAWARHGGAPAALNVLPARDDVGRLGLLRDGSAAAALLSSAVSPDTMQALGYEPRLFLGDEFQLATTGLAATVAQCEGEPGLVRRVCACYREAIDIIHRDDSTLQAVLAEVITAAGSGAGSLAVALRRCYTRDGTSAPATLAGGAELMARAVGLAVRPVDELYDFRFLS